ncbi:MAG: flippase-like domain-containing protein, partial [Spirochaetota bacterium]|nr:flippase-like domain-containing protein [Spirochaetota bacterium]
MMKKLQIVFTLIGVGIFVYLIYQIGITNIIAQLKTLGWALFIVMIPYLGVLLFDGIGWNYVILVKERKFSFLNVMTVKLAGDFVNYTSPAGSIAGEPVKAHILKHYGVDFVEGMASVYMAKLLMAKAQLLFIILGAVLAFFGLVNISDKYIIIAGAVIGVFTLAMGVIYYIGLKKGIMNMFLTFLQKVRVNFAFMVRQREQFNLFDEKITHFYTHHKKEFILSMCSFFVSWVFGAVEIFVGARFLNINISFHEAIMIESVNTIWNTVTFFVPFRGGVQEVGYVALFNIFLSNPASKEAGLAFAIIKRFRELIWLGLGMILLSHYNFK